MCALPALMQYIKVIKGLRDILRLVREGIPVCQGICQVRALDQQEMLDVDGGVFLYGFVCGFIFVLTLFSSKPRLLIS